MGSRAWAADRRGSRRDPTAPPPGSKFTMMLRKPEVIDEHSIPYERLAAMSEAWTFGTFRKKLAGDKLTALPEYVVTWEGPEEAKHRTQRNAFSNKIEASNARQTTPFGLN